MTNPQRTLIAVLLDRSGSMQSIKSDTEGGFNAFIAEQAKEPGEATVTLAQFDTEYEVVYANRPIADVPPLQLEPRSMTALLDALGRLVTDVGSELAALPEVERPGHVIVVVMTDGLENSSVEWTAEAVNAVITRQEGQYAWDFVFLGANMDAIAVGEQLGFAPDKSLTYAPTDVGVAYAMASTNSYVSRKRAAAPAASVPGFSDEDRVGAKGSRG